jgi:hypothetical protein
MSLDEEEITIAKPIQLGILGSREATYNKIVDCMMPILSELGRCPETIICPSEGHSSAFITDWSEKTKIRVQVYDSDWYRLGKRARVFRDTRIINESTHLLVFLNKKSVYYENMANNLAKKGKTVFTVKYSDWELEELVVEKSKK